MTTHASPVEGPGVSKRAGSRSRARLAMIGLLVCFFVPASVAWILFFTGWTPSVTSNYGTLIEPPRPVDALYMDPRGDALPPTEFHGYWSLLLHEPGACGDACTEKLDLLSRVRVALAQNADRVHLGLVSVNGLPDDALPDRVSHYRWADPLAQQGLMAEGSDQRGLVLVDPRGYAMMWYGADAAPSGLLKDLKKLLKISNLDLERLQGFVEGN